MTGIEVVIAGIAITVVTPLVAVGVTKVGEASERSDAEGKALESAAAAPLREELGRQLSAFPPGESCFARAISIGDRVAFTSAFDSAAIVVDPSKTKDAQASAKDGVLYLRDTPENLIASDSDGSLKVTLWHETAHLLEYDNGDRNGVGPTFMAIGKTFGSDSFDNYRERHTEYMEHMNKLLNALTKFEEGISEGAVSPEKSRQRWKLLERRFREGSFNSYEAVPSDLEEFASYTGFRADLDEIRALYESGECLELPEGVLGDEPISDELPSGTGEAGPFVVWKSTNVGSLVGITTVQGLEEEVLARDFKGGGVDPELVLEREQLIGSEFETEEEARLAACAQMTDVRTRPTHIQPSGLVGEDLLFLTNFSCAESETADAGEPPDG